MFEEKNKDAKKVLLYLSLKYKGDWDMVCSKIGKEIVDETYLANQLSKMKFKYITILDKDYPEQLKGILKPPLVLYYYGDISLLQKERILGVAGSRNASSYGLSACSKIISEIEDKEIVILSGLARGIDAVALNSAKKNNLKMIGILGTGIDYCYPSENYPLYKKMKEDGLIISEYPYKEIVSKKNFTFRNRLVAAFSNILFIPEVKERSGTLVTIKYALSMNKPVMVVPTSIFEENYNNHILKCGGELITTGKDLNYENF